MRWWHFWKYDFFLSFFFKKKYGNFLLTYKESMRSRISERRGTSTWGPRHRRKKRSTLTYILSKCYPKAVIKVVLGSNSNNDCCPFFLRHTVRFFRPIFVLCFFLWQNSAMLILHLPFFHLVHFGLPTIFSSRMKITRPRLKYE